MWPLWFRGWGGLTEMWFRAGPNSQRESRKLLTPPLPRTTVFQQTPSNAKSPKAPMGSTPSKEMESKKPEPQSPPQAAPVDDDEPDEW